MDETPEARPLQRFLQECIRQHAYARALPPLLCELLSTAQQYPSWFNDSEALAMLREMFKVGLLPTEIPPNVTRSMVALIAEEHLPPDEPHAKNGVASPRAEHRPFPRVWELFAFILNHRTRERVWEPMRHELLADYIQARRYRTQWARRWIAFAFTVRTLWGVLDCFRVMVTSSTGRFLGRLIPPRLREWWLQGP